MGRLLILATVVIRALAQDIASTISGSVRTFSTESESALVTPSVAPGTYRLVLQASGFKRLDMRESIRASQ